MKYFEVAIAENPDSRSDDVSFASVEETIGLAVADVLERTGYGARDSGQLRITVTTENE